MPRKQSYIPNELILPFSGSRHTDDPVVIEGGAGAYLQAEDGRQFYDATSSLWVANLGHGHPAITNAIRRQLDKVAHSTLFGQAHKPAIELAERLPEFAELSDYYTFFCNSGSEAVETSIKLALNYWLRKESQSKRTKILTFHNSYHGETAGAMGASGFDMHSDLYPGLPYQTVRAASPAVTEFEKSQTTQKHISLEEAVRQFDDQIAAVIVEPLHGAGGIVPVPSTVLKEIQRICAENGYLFIVDEVATGFYRAGGKFHYQDLDLRPDMLVLGKGISAGYLPLSVVLMHPQIGEMYSREQKREPFMHGHTFSGNPLACAAAISNLDVLSEPETVRGILQLQDLFRGELECIFRHEHSINVRQRGLIAGIELFGDGLANDLCADIALDVCNALKRRNILVRPLGNVIVLAPPYVSSEQDIRMLVENVHESVASFLGTHDKT
ncbi:MAG: aminotransferase class III-fold pyridoxal phosphate-dependent enzyme [Candidatus Peribacteraceae bacterium]|nr:aminotransferase class III-fold pyridoxal phosphate-dependent enzyme [Candidatus Peribacteraceae bacterium]